MSAACQQLSGASSFAARGLPLRCAARRCAGHSRGGAAALVVRAEAAGERYQVVLKKPLGIFFAERKNAAGEPAGVAVDELVPGGNAEKSGKVAVGDVLLRCSAVVLKDGSESGAFEKEGYGARPYTNWEKITFDARNATFDAVMGAIASNNERWGFFDVQMELERSAAGAQRAPPPAAAPKPAAAAAAKPAAKASGGVVRLEIADAAGKFTEATLNSADDGTLRTAMMKAGVSPYAGGWDSMMNCGGAGQCAMCGVDVLEGGELLTERTGVEERKLAKRGPGARLSCQSALRDGAEGTLKVQATPAALKK